MFTSLWGKIAAELEDVLGLDTNHKYYQQFLLNTKCYFRTKPSFVFPLHTGPGLPISTLHDGRTDQGTLSCMLLSCLQKF